MEVPSEDPFHSGQYGTAVVRGVQWGNANLSVVDPRYTKVNAALKVIGGVLRPIHHHPPTTHPPLTLPPPSASPSPCVCLDANGSLSL